MKILDKIGLFVAILGFCCCSEETKVASKTDLTRIIGYFSPSENSTDKIITIDRINPKDSELELSKNELSAIKSAAFNALANETLYNNDQSYRENPKKGKCIIEYIEKLYLNDELTSDVEEVNFENVSIKFYCNDKNSQKLTSFINDASNSCFISGVILLIILAVLMVLIVGVVLWFSKSQSWLKMET